MKAVLLALVLTQGADAAITCGALRSGQFVEQNPLFGANAGCGRVVALKTATVLPLALVLPKLHKRHPKWAVGLGLVPTVAAGTAVVINVRRITR